MYGVRLVILYLVLSVLIVWSRLLFFFSPIQYELKKSEYLNSQDISALLVVMLVTVTLSFVVSSGSKPRRKVQNII